jgi:hypothetical protein
VFSKLPNEGFLLLGYLRVETHSVVGEEWNLHIIAKIAGYQGALLAVQTLALLQLQHQDMTANSGLPDRASIIYHD